MASFSLPFIATSLPLTFRFLVDVTRQVRELNDRVNDVRRQQEYQKEHEAKFRDTAESVNSRVVWFIILQVIVLVLTTAWQTRHLTVFLKSKKVA